MNREPLNRVARAHFGIIVGAALLEMFVTLTRASASDSIVIEYNRGRNKVAVDLWKNAEDQLDKGDVASAHRSVDAALRSDPTLYPAFYTRAKVYRRENKWEAALQDCNSALHEAPTFVEAALFRASINSHFGRYAECLKELDHIVSIRPRWDALARALSQRAWLRLTCADPHYRDPKQALKDANTACKIMQWRDDDMIDTLAVACAETGDFNAAVRYETQALSTAGILPEDAKMYREHLALFKAKRAP